MRSRCVALCTTTATTLAPQVSVASSLKQLPDLSSAYSNKLLDLTRVSVKAKPLAMRLNRRGIALQVCAKHRQTTGVDEGLDFVMLRLWESASTAKDLTRHYAQQHTVSLRTAENRIGRALHILEVAGVIKREQNKVQYEPHWL